jgi:hypothetical protein
MWVCDGGTDEARTMLDQSLARIEHTGEAIDHAERSCVSKVKCS